MKLPAFQFYPGDWRKDAGVQSLDYESRGIWFEILCILHESERRGVLLLNGKSMPESALAKLLGISEAKIAKTLEKLTSHGVLSRDTETGAVMSRRMVRDDAFRKTRAACGKLGGNPAITQTDLNRELKVDLKVTPKVEPTPSSSSSSSVPPNPQDAPASPPQGGRKRKVSNQPPDDPAAVRIAVLFGRRPTTPWDEKEIRKFRAIGEIDPADLSLIERYYFAERAKGDDGRHRRDLATFLNNFTGELDRARALPPTAAKEFSAPQPDPAGWSEWLEQKGLQYSPFATSPPNRKEVFARR